jgi:coenzyme F420-reducing hydrogenase delta subunit
MLDYLGVDKNRTRVEWVSASEGDRFAEVMNEFTADVKAIGPSRKLEDLRCKAK